MQVKNILKTQKQGIALEFFPPKNPADRETFLKTVRELIALSALYASMTYGAGGTTQDRTFSALKWIRGETDLPLMSHLTCIGATRASLGALLEAYHTAGIENILALRGDPPKNAPDFDRVAGDFKYA
ncbi:MAG TPA: methylenetetrahydrofolate reductase [Nitrospirota bacterium]|nr:methylenetetrahydrofolate reductase [Nitrospirota bacterium]